MVLVNHDLQHALKEWAIAVDALSFGKTVVLLRKGGIREADFQVQHPRFWLYPTYEHQKPHLLKPEYAQQVTSVPSGWHPDTVTIKSYAEITKVFQIAKLKQIEALQPYHIWHEDMVRDRLKWKAKKPLAVLLLRVYRLADSQTITYNPTYGGCKSWIELLESIDNSSSVPAIGDREYAVQTEEVEAAIA